MAEPLAPQLVTAADIAKSRIEAMPAGTFEQNAARMMRYYAELFRATQEKRDGEWKLEES